jgi:hypothetical protein
MQKFIDYHLANPEIYQAFKTFAQELIQAGNNKIGSKMITERIRWESKISKVGKYKVNNNYTADFARLFEIEFPEHEGIFEKRICRSREKFRNLGNN